MRSSEKAKNHTCEPKSVVLLSVYHADLSSESTAEEIRRQFPGLGIGFPWSVDSHIDHKVEPHEHLRDRESRIDQDFGAVRASFDTKVGVFGLLGDERGDVALEAVDQTEM